MSPSHVFFWGGAFQQLFIRIRRGVWRSRYVDLRYHAGPVLNLVFLLLCHSSFIYSAFRAFGLFRDTEFLSHFPPSLTAGDRMPQTCQYLFLMPSPSSSNDTRLFIRLPFLHPQWLHHTPTHQPAKATASIIVRSSVKSRPYFTRSNALSQETGVRFF